MDHHPEPADREPRDEETSGLSASPWALPAYPAGRGPAPRSAVASRDAGLRRVRRATNWAIAALLVAVGATTAQLGHLANASRTAGSAAPAVGAPLAVSGGSGTAAPTATRNGAPSLSAPVAVSGGS